MQVLRTLSLVFLGCFVAGLTFLLLERQDRSGQDGAALPAGADNTRLERLEQELALLRGSVDELVSAVRDSRLEAPAPQRVPADGGGPANDRLLDELRAMEDRLANLLRDTEDTNPGLLPTDELLARIKAPDAFPDWAAWQPVIDLWHQDRDAARKEVKLLTAEQVLERFGSPTDVWSNTNGITWQYARDWDPVREKHGLEIILRIPGGYVTQLVVR